MDDTSLLAPISADAPCGADLEYDAAFLALEQSLAGADTDRAVGPDGEGNTVDWKQVAESAQLLLSRTHDLRVGVILSKAWLNMHGLVGLNRGLAYLQQLLSLRWGSVHPQLGAQGDSDGLMRVNALRGLCDAMSVVTPLRAAPLLRARGLRALCLRDLDAALSNTPQPDGTLPDTTTVEASFIGCDLDELTRTAQSAEQAFAAASALEQLFTEHATPAVLRLSELTAQLESISGHLVPRVRARRAALSAQVELRDDPGAALAQPVRPAAASSRTEVLRELDRLCAYYDTHEPTSPVPILLRRARRIANLSFLELVRELAPGGSAEIETLRGPQLEEQA